MSFSNVFNYSSNEGQAGTGGTGGTDGASGPSGPINISADQVIPDWGKEKSVDTIITNPQNPIALPGDLSTKGNGGTVGLGDTVLPVIGTTTEAQKNEQLEAQVPSTALLADSFYQSPRASEGTIGSTDGAGGTKTNSHVYRDILGLGQDDISPFTDDLNVLKPSEHKPSKLESVGIYKTIDLISEGPVAGLCDVHGNLIPLVDGADTLNEDGLKGLYLNDVPVKNSRGGTLNYQRVLSEIKYGTLKQGLMQDNKQKALSFLRSSQTFNVGLKLPGLNNDQSLVFSGDDIVATDYSNVNFTPHIFKTPPPGTTKGDLLEYDIYSWTDTKAGKQESPGADYQKLLVQNQMVTIGKEANYVSIFTQAKTTNAGKMIERMRTVFAEQPVVYHHTITNDNVTDIEVNLFTDQLFLRDINPEKAKDPLNNTIFFLIKIGYEDSDLLISETGGDTFYAFVPISGLCSSRYERAYTFPLPVVAADRDRRISICLASEEPAPDAVAVGAIQRQGGVATITEIVDAPLVYPHSAIIAMLIDGRSFGRVPKRTFDTKLLKIKIPANYDGENREYTGNWTGQWASHKQWSNNPAWVFYDMMTSRRYGLAKYGFGDDIVDKWNLYSIGKYCDELVETGYRPADLPLLFSVDPNGALIYINDAGSNLDGSARGEEVLKGMFPQGETVALYRLKDKSGTALNRGFRRRIGACSYDKTTHIFTFNIHKIINSEYIFTTYAGLQQQYTDFNDSKQEKSKITANAWIANYLTRKSAEGDESDVIQEYMAGYSLGSTVSTGKVVVEKSLYKPVLEPRFSTNIYLDREQDAYNCLNDLAAIFRGMVYWNNGFVFISNDQSRDAVMVFTNSNVQAGAFTYTGSAKSTRFSSVLVRYNDAQDSYKPKVEYIEDAASIRKYGYLEKKIIALGTTSRSQAYRLGKWFLFTNQLETDLVQFKAGIEATYLRPGDVVKIQDNLKNTKRYGGRIKAIDPANYQLTLDQGIYENVVGQKITLIVPQPSKAVTQLNIDAQEKLQQRDFTGIEQSEIDETRATQIKQFTVTAVTGSDANSGGVQNDVITVEASEEFSRVDVGTIWSMQNTETEYKIKGVEYRILSVTEETAGQYGVTGMMYAGSKFGAIDESRDLVSTQQSASILNSDEELTVDSDFEAGDTADAITIVDTGHGAKEGDKKQSAEGSNKNSNDLEEDSGEEVVVVLLDFYDQAQAIERAVDRMWNNQPSGDPELEGISQAYVTKFFIHPSIDGWQRKDAIAVIMTGGNGVARTQAQVEIPVPEGTRFVQYSLGYEVFTGFAYQTVWSETYSDLGGGD